MARKARERSRSGIYHVMLRGINHHTIFEDEEDYRKYLQTIKDYQDKLGYTLYAYCLMDNHIHLLMEEGAEELAKIFQTIGARFVYWYNWKYERRGNLFQGRYKSETIEDDKYFLTVIRYIHQNPLKAGIVKRLEDYKWSSYNEYIGKPDICSTDFCLDMFSSNREKAVELFKEYNAKENQDACLDYNKELRLNDSEAREIIKKIASLDTPREVIDLDEGKKKEVIKLCREGGLSIRQISRLTGISIGVIRGNSTI